MLATVITRDDGTLETGRACVALRRLPAMVAGD